MTVYDTSLDIDLLHKIAGGKTPHNSRTLFPGKNKYSIFRPIKLKILLLAFKAIHGLAPAYISNLLVIKRKSSYNIRSNSGILLEPPRGKMLATLGERAFQAAAPQLWNELPLQLRTIGSVEIFKNSIKTFLFKRFFNSE